MQGRSGYPDVMTIRLGTHVFTAPSLSAPPRLTSRESRVESRESRGHRQRSRVSSLIADHSYG
jgi:hypothetical protein